MRKRAHVAIFATHPIQYHIPWFIHLSNQPEIDLKVYYQFLPDSKQQGIGFNVPFQWDIPMLEGYEWDVLTDSKAQRSIQGLLKVKRPDIVILTGWQASFLWRALGACMMFRIPRMVRAESNNMRKRRPWNHLAHRLLFSEFDGFLAIGRANREFYLENGVDPRKIFYSPYFVDNDRLGKQFQTALSEKGRERSYWSIPSDVCCFLYVGKLESKKRILDLLEALKIAVQKNKKIHLLVVGDGPLKDKANRFVLKHHLPVSFTGFLNQSEITRAYAAGDCLVLPSDCGETWGLVVNEAMLCGRPPLVSDRVGCGPDLIAEGVTGSIFPFGDVKILAKKLLEFASDPDRLREMGLAARKKVESYCVENAVKGTMEGIEAVLKNGVTSFS